MYYGETSFTPPEWARLLNAVAVMRREDHLNAEIELRRQDGSLLSLTRLVLSPGTQPNKLPDFPPFTEIRALGFEGIWHSRGVFLK